VSPLGRRERIEAPGERLGELAAWNIGSLDPKFGSFCPGPGTISESVRLVRGADGRTIAMRIEYLAAIAIVAAGTGLAVHSVGVLPPEKQSAPAAAQLATRLAEPVDPFLLRSGG
jgi:hypothetical protein